MKVEKKGKSIIVYCDCGDIHTITQNATGELEMTTDLHDPEIKNELKKQVKDDDTKEKSIFDIFN